MIPPELIISHIKQVIPLSCSKRKEALMTHYCDVRTCSADLLSNQIIACIKHKSHSHISFNKYIHRNLGFVTKTGLTKTDQPFVPVFIYFMWILISDHLLILLLLSASFRHNLLRVSVNKTGPGTVIITTTWSVLHSQHLPTEFQP